MLELDPKIVQIMAPAMERVLLVDPAPASARLLSDLLHNIWPGQVWTAPTVEAGLQMAQGVDPKLLFVEYAGEELDGLRFTRTLRRSALSCRKAPVIMITGQATPAVILGARDSGVHEFLRKPFTNRDLVRRIEAVTRFPRDWVEGIGYVGPDRRRFNSADYQGARKRNVDAASDPEQARLVQALRIVAAAAEALESDPTQALRALRAQSDELQRLSKFQPAGALGTAAAGLKACLAEVERGAPLTRTALQPHAVALAALMPKDAAALSRSAA